MGVLCGQASGIEILLGEGEDVEVGARTSKHILLFALNPLTLSISLFTLCLAIIYIVHSYLLGLVVCASFVDCT